MFHNGWSSAAVLSGSLKLGADIRLSGCLFKFPVMSLINAFHVQQSGSTLLPWLLVVTGLRAKSLRHSRDAE